MTNEQAANLKTGDMLRHSSGNLYRVIYAPTAADARIGVVGRRGGQDFGPFRSIKAEALELVETSTERYARIERLERERAEPEAGR
jgi:hypothetical protein